MASVIMQLNTNINALSQNDIYDFDVMAEHDGELYGFSSAGAFKVAGDTADSEDISASFTLPTTDFGIHNQKTFRSIALQYEATDVLSITVTNDEDYAVSLSVPSTLGLQSGAKIACPRDSRGVSHSVQISNTEGAYFAIDTVDVLCVVQANKLGIPSITR